MSELEQIEICERKRKSSANIITSVIEHKNQFNYTLFSLLYLPLFSSCNGDSTNEPETKIEVYEMLAAYYLATRFGQPSVDILNFDGFLKIKGVESISN